MVALGVITGLWPAVIGDAAQDHRRVASRLEDSPWQTHFTDRRRHRDERAQHSRALGFVAGGRGRHRRRHAGADRGAVHRGGLPSRRWSCRARNDVAVVLRSGATNEMSSGFRPGQVTIIATRRASSAHAKASRMVSPELYVLAEGEAARQGDRRATCRSAACRRRRRCCASRSRSRRAA